MASFDGNFFRRLWLPPPPSGCQPICYYDYLLPVITGTRSALRKVSPMKSFAVFLAPALIGSCFFLVTAMAQIDKGIQGADVGLAYQLETSMGFDYPGVTLTVLPDGSGPSFTLARWFDGNMVQFVDGTITVKPGICASQPHNDCSCCPPSP